MCVGGRNREYRFYENQPLKLDSFLSAHRGVLLRPYYVGEKSIHHLHHECLKLHTLAPSIPVI